MWPSMGSMLHCLWLQKMSLFTFVLKLDSVPTQGLSDSEHSSCPAVQHLAPSWHHAQLLELQELKTLAISETLATSKTGIPPGLLLYLYCSPLPSRTSQECSTQGEGADCPQLLTALTTALQCFSSPTPRAATRVTLRLSGQTQ